MEEASTTTQPQIRTTESIKSELKGKILKGAFCKVTVVPIMCYYQSSKCYDTSKEKHITEQMKLRMGFSDYRVITVE